MFESVKFLLPVFTVICLLFISSCDTHQMGYAEKDSEMNFLDATDTCYNYWIEVDEDGYEDSITFAVSANGDSLPGRPLSYHMQVFSCDSSGGSPVPLRSSSILFQPEGRQKYCNNDSMFLDLSDYTDSSMYFADYDSSWRYSADIRFIFGFNDTIEPPFLSVKFTTVMLVQEKKVERTFDFFLVRKLITIPHSGSLSHPGKLFCDRTMDKNAGYFMISKARLL